jgi:hypothetical protein
MSVPIYYQWQNEHLLRTIYPLREMKLRDFLIYFREIDLWQEYKEKTPEDLGSEVQAHQAAQRELVSNAYDRYVELKAYFEKADVSDEYRQKFSNMDDSFMEKINRIHRDFNRWFPTYNSLAKERNFLALRITEMEGYRKETEKAVVEKERRMRNMGEKPGDRQEIEKLKNITASMANQEIEKLYAFLAAFVKVEKWRKDLNQLKDKNTREQAGITSRLNQLAREKSRLEGKLAEIKIELSRLNDSLVAYENAGRPTAWIKSRITENEKQASQVESQLSIKVHEMNSLQKQSRQLEAVINRPEKERLMAFADLHDVTVRDIVRGKVESYQNSLAQMNHEELLEEVVHKFLADPGRYPLWLQNMVIHFSGMRYKSAHGSWADPKDLLFSLKVREIEKSYKLKDDDTIEALCQERIAGYRTGFDRIGGEDQPAAREGQSPKLAQAQDSQWKAKVDHHLKRLERATYAYHKRKALLDLLIDEESYEIESLKDQEALELLEGKKGQLPPWMWNEIVRLTGLKLKEVKDENWEELSSDDLIARQDYKAWELREIMDKWKRENLTGWREEHDRSNRLIVSRAVCNEVAEHIQHLRGNSPPGGLTAKPEWYLRKEKDPKLAGSDDRPYFVKPKSLDDFKEGASLLWLRHVDRQPNAWQIAHPIRLKNGEGLLASMGSLGGNNKAADKRGTNNSKGVGANQNKPAVSRYLRWMHEATVAEIGYTADGPVVLTFETALPYEDKRQSTIGVFKHSAYNLNHNPATGALTFVGYTPKADVHYDDLREMLDWNKILRKQVLSEEQMEAYWDKVVQIDRKPAATLKGNSDGAKPSPVTSKKRLISPAEVAPPISMIGHRERIVCYDIDPARKQAVVYEPRVDLRRGLHLWVARGEAIKVGTRTYLPVARCDGEPRAQELYVREEEIIAAPEDRASFPVTIKEKLNLRKLIAANKSKKPIMDRSTVQIPAGTKLRVSAVHKVTPADPGNGIIDADGPDDYYLIVECPTRISAEGLFLRTKDVIKINEEEYKSQKAKMPQQVTPPAVEHERVQPPAQERPPLSGRL